MDLYTTHYSIYFTTNGVAERKYRTTVEMARNMMAGKGQPKIFWPCRSNQCNNLYFELFIKKDGANKTPYEAWYHKKPQVNNLKVFGCFTYSLIPSQQREKFEDKVEKIIFIGYSEES